MRTLNLNRRNTKGAKNANWDHLILILSTGALRSGPDPDVGLPRKGADNRRAGTTKLTIAPSNSGKEEESHIQKPFTGALRVRIPSGRSGTSGRKRVLRGGGRLPLRSVDSETKCRVIEPRNSQLWRASAVRVSGGHVESVDKWSHFADSVSPGSESKANGHEGSPGTWEILAVP